MTAAGQLRAPLPRHCAKVALTPLVVLVGVEISPTHYTASFDYDLPSLDFVPSLPMILILSLRHESMGRLPQGCEKYGPGVLIMMYSLAPGHITA